MTITPYLPSIFHRFPALLRMLAGVLCLSFASLAVAAGPGSKVYHEYREKGGLYADEGWQEYVSAIGERLLKADGHDPQDFTFAVIDNPIPNAVAYPDGFIFVHRGLLPYLRSEDELAGVIGHEIGHVLARHGYERQRNRRLSQIGGFLAALATGTGTMWDLTNSIAATLQSGYGREAELEADQYGAMFLAKGGYSPLAMIDGIQALKDHELFMKQVSNQPPVYHGLFASHPKNDKRLHELVQSVQHLAPEQLAEPVGDFWAHMDGLVFGDEAATGLIKDGVYYHGALRVVVRFPEGWDVTNTTAEILGRAPGGTDEASIGLQRQSLPGEEQTPEEYVSKTLKRDDVENGETVVINGYPTYVGDIKVIGDLPKARKIAVVFKADSVYVFQGEVGEQGEVEQFAKDFVETIASFRSMTAADLQVANAQRIRVLEARPGMTYKALATRSSVKRFPEETLRTINGHHPRGEPRAGDLIKTVQ